MWVLLFQHKIILLDQPLKHSNLITLKESPFLLSSQTLLEIYNDTSEPVRVSNGDGAELIIKPQSTHQFGLISNEPIKSKEITLFLSHPTYTQIIYLVVPVKYDG